LLVCRKGINKLIPNHSAREEIPKIITAGITQGIALVEVAAF